MREAPEHDLPFRHPFDGRALIGFFAARVVRGVEEVTADGAYRRSLRLPHGAGVVELSASARARFWLDDPRDTDDAVERCRRLFDLDADPGPIADALGDDPLIGSLVRRNPGRRVPGAADGAEIAVRAVLGQQVSLKGAATAAARLVVAHGDPLSRPVGGVTHLFPAPAALTQAEPALPRARRRALQELSRALAVDRALLERRADLLALPGIGPWTTGYVAMRAAGDRDAFLANDLGVRHALEALGVPGDPRCCRSAGARTGRTPTSTSGRRSSARARAASWPAPGRGRRCPGSTSLW